MPRMQIIRHQRDFTEATEGVNGFQVLTNVSFDSGAPETVRLNLGLNTSSLRRETQPPIPGLLRNERWFEIHNPSVLLSAPQLAEFQKNFAAIHEVLGDRRLGNIPIGDPIHETLLPMFQARSYEITWINSFLDTVNLGSALYQSYLLHPMALQLFNADQPTNIGATLLGNFKEAVELYSQVPELRAYSAKGDLLAENIGPRGEQFRGWLEENNAIDNGDGVLEGDVVLEYVDHQLRPLRISGGNFHWLQNAAPENLAMDLRRVAVDLLLRYEGHPVWCEVKAKGDTWTSSALQQILFYGSMICCGNQLRRCSRIFFDQFDNSQPWLGILVEERDEIGFVEDFVQTVKFVRHPNTQTTLRDLFGGVIFGMLKSTDDRWALSRTEVIPL